MNPDEIKNLIQVIFTLVGPILIAHGVVTGTDWTGLTGALLALVGPVWSIVGHWNQKKVPETSTAIAIGPNNIVPAVGSPTVATVTGKVVGCLLALLLASALLSPGAAHAQSNRVPKEPTVASSPSPQCDPLRLMPGCKLTETTAEDMMNKLDSLALPDFEFALAQATATNNTVTAPCWQAWIDLIKARQKASVDANGNPLPVPDPHLITGIERISEMLAILRPDSKISLACVQIASTAKQDVALFVTSVITGGALGLFKLPIPIGPIP